MAARQAPAAVAVPASHAAWQQPPAGSAQQTLVLSQQKKCSRWWAKFRSCSAAVAWCWPTASRHRQFSASCKTHPQWLVKRVNSNCYAEKASNNQRGEASHAVLLRSAEHETPSLVQLTCEHYKQSRSCYNAKRRDAGVCHQVNNNKALHCVCMQPTNAHTPWKISHCTPYTVQIELPSIIQE